MAARGWGRATNSSKPFLGWLDANWLELSRHFIVPKAHEMIYMDLLKLKK